jgi:hypothetical protein
MPVCSGPPDEAAALQVLKGADHVDNSELLDVPRKKLEVVGDSESRTALPAAQPKLEGRFETPIRTNTNSASGFMLIPRHL